LIFLNKNLKSLAYVSVVTGYYRVAGLGGNSLKKMMIRIHGMIHIPNSTKSSIGNWLVIYWFVAWFGIKRAGRKKPIELPIELAADKTAKAKALWIYVYIHLWLKTIVLLF